MGSSFLLRPTCFIKDLFRSTSIFRSENFRLPILQATPEEFAAKILENGRRRVFVAYDRDNGVPVASESTYSEISDYFRADPINYREHECVFLEVGKRSNALLSAFIWRTNRGQACGGIRMWKYNTMQEYLHDGIRLSTGMGHKSALAGLWAGGGKGVVQQPSNHRDPDIRRNVFLDYGDFLTSLNGCYIGAEDVGLTVDDLDHVHARTRFVTCISPNLGGSGNPSGPTGLGVVRAMEAASHFRNMGDLEGKKVVIQGTGNVAQFIIDELLRLKAGEIIASECDAERYNAATKKYENETSVKLVRSDIGDLSILSEPCDILSPCALGGILNESTIPKLQTPIVCGAANNQLATPDNNKLLDQMGITYVVDFVANRMGIVNCANETYGYVQNDPYFEQHLGSVWENSVYKIVTKILETSRDKGITSVEAAEELANELSLENHPIWGRRSLKIIQSLTESQWHKQI